MGKSLLLNPFNPDHFPLVVLLVQQQINLGRYPIQIDAFKVYRLDSDAMKPVRYVVLTHTLLDFCKDTNFLAERRFMILVAQPFSGGCTAATYHVPALLKNKGQGWTLNRNRLFIFKRDRGEDPRLNKLKWERDASRSTSLRTKYPVTQFMLLSKPTDGLLQRLQEGITLSQLLKSLKNKTLSLSVLERFKLSLNLTEAVEAIYKQELIVDGINLGFMIHRDIKPDNILVSCDLSIRIIDFAFAWGSNLSLTSYHGTKLYMAPEILNFELRNNRNFYIDSRIDQFALAIILLQLWGSTCRDFLISLEDLEAQNQDIPVRETLFHQVWTLTHEEQEAIKEVLHAQTRFDPKVRGTFEDLKKVFKRLIGEREKNSALPGARAIHDLYAPKIVELLHSNPTIQVLERIKEEFAHIVKKLGIELFKLPEGILDMLSQAGCNFRQLSLGFWLYLYNPYFEKHWEKLISLGAQLAIEDLTEWLKSSSPHTEEDCLQWLSTMIFLLRVKPIEMQTVLANHQPLDSAEFKRFFLQTVLPLKIEDANLAFTLYKRYRDASARLLTQLNKMYAQFDFSKCEEGITTKLRRLSDAASSSHPLFFCGESVDGVIELLNNYLDWKKDDHWLSTIYCKRLEENLDLDFLMEHWESYKRLEDITKEVAWGLFRKQTAVHKIFARILEKIDLNWVSQFEVDLVDLLRPFRNNPLSDEELHKYASQILKGLAGDIQCFECDESSVVGSKPFGL